MITDSLQNDIHNNVAYAQATCSDKSGRATSEGKSEASESNWPVDIVEISYQYRQGGYKTFKMPEDGNTSGHFLSLQKGGYINARNYWVENGFQGIIENIYNSDAGHDSERAIAVLQELIPQRKNLSDDLKTILKENGLGSIDASKLKIEIGSNGRIMVGGLKDARKLREIQDVFNKQTGLAARIKEYQEKEKTLKIDLDDMGLLDLYNGRKGMEVIEEKVRTGEFDENGLTTEVFDGPLHYAIAELYSNDGPDFSSTEKGVADPMGTLNKEFSRAKQSIEELFSGENYRAKEAAQKTGKPESAEVMSMQNVKIKISEDGQIEFEGKFAKSDSVNSTAEAIARKVLEDMFRMDGEGADRIGTAMTSLKMLHDEVFGESDSKKAEVQISGTGVTSYITDPKGKKQAKDAIRQNAAAFLTEKLGVTFTEQNIAVDEKGVISITETPKGISAEQAEKVINELNKTVSNHSNPEADSGQQNGPTVERIITAIKQLNSYGPEGDRSYTYAAYDSKKETEEDEELGIKAVEFRDQYKYTYADPHWRPKTTRTMTTG